MKPCDPVSRSKNQAALIKRTSSSIATILQDMSDLSEGDRRSLKDAERILRDLGAQASRRAKQVKANEDRLAKLEGNAARQVREALAGWFLDDVEGKVAIFLTAKGLTWGRRNLEDDLNGYVTFSGVKVEPKLRNLVSRTVEAKEDIIRTTAYNAVRAKYIIPVAEQMAKYRQAFDQIKASADARDLVKRWKVALVQEQLENANRKECDAAKAY